jgi:hypothetical protein
MLREFIQNKYKFCDLGFNPDEECFSVFLRKPLSLGTKNLYILCYDSRMYQLGL